MLMLLIPVLAGTPVPKNPGIDPPKEEPATAARGTILFDARVPVEIRMDKAVVGQLFQPGRLSIDSSIGVHQVQVVTNGNPRELSIDVSDVTRTVVLIGRNGLTSSKTLLAEPDVGDAPVEFRVSGRQDVMVSVGEERWFVGAEGSKAVQIPVGEHKMMVRSGDGHVLWARGRIHLTRTTPTIIQLSEGRLPEVSGPGASFHSGR